MQLSITERSLIVEALQKCASRHESEARFRPRSAKPHDDKAAAMRKLARRIGDEEKAKAPPFILVEYK